MLTLQGGIWLLLQFRKKARNNSTADKTAHKPCLPIYLLLIMYRFMSRISVWSLGKMTEHGLFLVSNELQYYKESPKFFYPVLCIWPFRPSLSPMDVLWAMSSKFRRILGICSSLLCASHFLWEPKTFKRQHRAFWVVSYSLFLTLLLYVFLSPAYLGQLGD